MPCGSMTLPREFQIGLPHGGRIVVHPLADAFLVMDWSPTDDAASTVGAYATMTEARVAGAAWAAQHYGVAA